MIETLAHADFIVNEFEPTNINAPDQSFPENGTYVHHGWQKVINAKKQKRQDARSKGPASGSIAANGNLGKKNDLENSVFKDLEKQAEERRAQREQIVQAAINGQASVWSAESNTQTHSDSDEGEEHDLENANGDGKISKPKKAKKTKVTVAEAASAIDASDLASFLLQISESFKDLPDVQLMRFADYFGRAFSQVTPSQFGWNKLLKEFPLVKAAQIPLLYIPDEVSRTAAEWIAAQPLDAVSDFVLWGLNDVVSDIQPVASHKGSKGTSGNTPAKTKVAILVILSVTLRKKPEALVQKAAALRNGLQFQGHEKLTMLAWAYAQVSQGDLVSGMQLWVQNLLPLAIGKACMPVSRDITLQFAESLLFANLKKARSVLLNSSSRKGERLVPPSSFMTLMHVSFPSESTRTKASERFQAIYPTVKEIALAGTKGSKATRTAAQQLLPLCLDAVASEDVVGLSYEAFDVFIWCLSENVDCYKQWEKIYMEKLDGSIKILNYMRADWGLVAGRLTSHELKKTILALRAQNKMSLEKAHGDAKLGRLLRTGDRHCKMLKQHLTRGGLCVKAMATVIAGLGIAYGFYLLNLNVPLVK